LSKKSAFLILNSSSFLLHFLAATNENEERRMKNEDLRMKNEELSRQPQGGSLRIACHDGRRRETILLPASLCAL
jgi:hypothetical protein